MHTHMGGVGDHWAAGRFEVRYLIYYVTRKLEWLVVLMDLLIDCLFGFIG